MAKGEARYKKPDQKPDGKEPAKSVAAPAAKAAETAGGDKKPEMMDTAKAPEPTSPTTAASVLSETFRRQHAEHKDMHTRHEREMKEMTGRHMNELGGNLTTADVGGGKTV